MQSQKRKNDQNKIEKAIYSPNDILNILLRPILPCFYLCLNFKYVELVMHNIKFYRFVLHKCIKNKLHYNYRWKSKDYRNVTKGKNS